MAHYTVNNNYTKTEVVPNIGIMCKQ